MTKTDDEIIEEIIREEYHSAFVDCIEYKPIDLKKVIQKAFTLKQNQQDELLNKFNEMVDRKKLRHGHKSIFHTPSYNKGLEKSKQPAKEVFTKTKEE